MPPQNIDMSVIREAMARRQSGGQMPAAAQMTSPSGQMPSGGMPTPTAGTSMPQAQGQNLTPRQGAPAQMPARVDDETRQMSKALVKKLLQYL